MKADWIVEVRSHVREKQKHMQRSAPVVVTCCAKAGLAIIRALGARKIPVAGAAYGNGQIGLSSRYLDAKLRCPDPAEREAQFIAYLERLPARWEGAVLFPSDDASLVALARHKERLSQRFRVVAQSWERVRDLIEKHRTYEIAREAGVPFPKLQRVRAADAALAFAREIGYPCLVKPSVGHLFFKLFGRKMLMPYSEPQLERALERLADYRGELMLCEFIPGPDTCSANYNSFCVRGHAVREFTAQKVRLKPVSIGFPTLVRSRVMPEVAEVGRRMAAAIGLDGFSCMEFKRDARDGAYKLMEVNGRHNYSGALASACGIDFPYLSYLHAQGLELPVEEHLQIPACVWIDEERDVLGALGALSHGLRAARAYLAPYSGRKVFATTSATDLKPTLSLVAASVTGALKRVRVSAPGAGCASLSSRELE